MFQRSRIAWNPRRFQQLHKIQDAPRNYGHVSLMKDMWMDTLVAVKQVPTWWMLEDQGQFLATYPGETEMPWMDVAIMSFLNQAEYPWSCQLMGVYCDCESTYVVTSLASEGDLYSWAAQAGLKSGTDREALVRPLAAQLFSAVRALHELSIVHRDLSCENILVTKSADDCLDGPPLEVRLIDFAAASTSRVQSSVVGKELYLAPEMHTSPCFDAFLTDAFALGVVLLSLLLQTFPWSSTKPGVCKSFAFVRKHGLRRYLTKRKFTGSDRPLISVLSDSCVDLLEGLLTIDPERRMTLGESGFPEGSRSCVWDVPWLAEAPDGSAHDFFRSDTSF